MRSLYFLPFLFIFGLTSCKTRQFEPSRALSGTQPEALFTKNEPLGEVTLIAPWKKLKLDDSPAVNEKIEFDAEIIFPSLSATKPEQRKIKATFRGSGRLNECDFPSLKVEFEKGAVEKTIFDGSRKVNLTSHCKKGLGAFPEEDQFALREWLGYRVFEIVDAPHFKTRRVSLVFKDSGNNSVERSTGFFTEKPEEMGDRYGATLIEDPDTFFKEFENFRARSTSEVEPLSLALSVMAATLVGSTDWAVFGYGEAAISEAKNFKLMTTPKGKLPAFHDFDLSVFVRGTKHVSRLEALGPTVYLANKPLVRRSALALSDYLLKNRKKGRINNEIVKQAKKIFLEKKESILSEILNRGLKPKSLGLLKEQVNSFYEALTNHFSLISPKHNAVDVFQDVAGTKKLCTLAPSSTVLKLGQQGNMTKVELEFCKKEEGFDVGFVKNAEIVETIL